MGIREWGKKELKIIFVNNIVGVNFKNKG